MVANQKPVEWFTDPPSAFDIVACWYPRPPDKHPGPDLRPCLVTGVLQGSTSGRYACNVCFGTKNLKIMDRLGRDVIVQNARHIDLFGLQRATRFDLDTYAQLPWNDRFFGFWSGYSSPILGSLDDVYVRDFAYKMMLRKGPKKA